MRIGPDDGASWKSWVETTAVAGGRNYFLNGRIWWNDPDCLYARKAFSLEQARTICSWTALSGQLCQSSDWLPDLPPERLDILRRTMPPHGRVARPVDLLDADPACVWLVTDQRACERRDVLGLFGFGPGRKKEIDLPLDRIGLPPAPPTPPSTIGPTPSCRRWPAASRSRCRRARAGCSPCGRCRSIRNC